MKIIPWLLPLVIWASDLKAQSSFYAGKTITVVAGVSAGSAYDLYARLMAQHMGKHIPGNPSFVAKHDWSRVHHRRELFI